MIVEPVNPQSGLSNRSRRTDWLGVLPRATRTCKVANVFKLAGVVQDGTGDGWARECPEGHERERHACAHADFGDFAHAHERLSHDRDEDPGRDTASTKRASCVSTLHERLGTGWKRGAHPYRTETAIRGPSVFAKGHA